jgi:hypothetical protein
MAPLRLVPGFCVVQDPTTCGCARAALLVDAITRADESGIGAYTLVVDTKDDPANAFYEHFGLVVLPGATMRLAIPMATALKVIGGGSRTGGRSRLDPASPKTSAQKNSNHPRCGIAAATAPASGGGAPY